MLPFCNYYPMYPGMIGIPPCFMPMMPFPFAPFDMSTTMTDEYDSPMYSRFRYVERDHPRYRHAPFDWYQPPKEHHKIVHEDAAVVTVDGPIPVADFYRFYIYGEGSDDDDDLEGSIGYERNSRSESDFDDEYI
jgi:hypothetical protein